MLCLFLNSDMVESNSVQRATDNALNRQKSNNLRRRKDCLARSAIFSRLVSEKERETREKGAEQALARSAKPSHEQVSTRLGGQHHHLLSLSLSHSHPLLFPFARYPIPHSLATTLPSATLYISGGCFGYTLRLPA